MPMLDLIRFVCVQHQSVDAQGVRRPDHVADMSWEQYQEYEGDCIWIGVVSVADTA